MFACIDKEELRDETNLTNYIQNRLDAVEIFSETQSSRNIELNDSLKTASKNQTGKQGYPDHIALVEDFILVMEDKSDRLKLVLRGGEISQSIDATQNYAINDALFYAHKNTQKFSRTETSATANITSSSRFSLTAIKISGSCPKSTRSKISRRRISTLISSA